MTKDEAVKYHREMWNWIADEVEKEGIVLRVPVLEKNWCDTHNTHPTLSCFACTYCGFKLCEDGCLFDWGSGCDFTICGRGYYGECVRAKTWQEQAELARKIANLPVREEV